MNRRNRFTFIASGSAASFVLVCMAYGCSASSDPVTPPAQGGATATGQGGATVQQQGGAVATGQGGAVATGQGGATTGQGGATSQGGATIGQGGAAAKGGAAAAGATSMSGGATGQGGASTAGATGSGGASTAGATSSGGASAGGASAGGASASGGAATAGASAGGAAAMCVSSDANCTTALAKTGAACTVNCCLSCGLGALGTKTCACDGTMYTACPCPRPATYLGKNPTTGDAATAPNCNETAGTTTVLLKNTACTTEWNQCIGTDSVAGSTPLGCVCMKDPATTMLKWYCGSTNKWFALAP